METIKLKREQMNERGQKWQVQILESIWEQQVS